MTQDKGLWAAIRRRKVLRTLGIYLAGAWVALQIVTTLVSIWQLPDWITQALFLLLALGLPIAAILSWNYDITEQGPVLTRGTGFSEILARLSRTGLFLAGLTAFVVSFAILFGLLHLWPDADLDPRIRHLIATPAASNDIPDNAAYLLYGFNAPAGQDPFQYGKFRTDAYETIGTLPDIPDALNFTLQPGDRWNILRQGVAGYFDEIDSVPVILEANRELMDRYLLLRQVSSFSEVIEPSIDSPIVPVQDLLLAEHLVRRKIAYDAAHGQLEPAWHEWREELEMRRQMLADANHLLLKMVAVSLVTEIVRQRILLLTHGYTEYAGPPVQRLTHPERSLVNPIRFDFVLSTNFILNLNNRTELAVRYTNTLPRFLITILPFRKNATANYAVYWLELANASLMDTPDLVAWLSTREPFHIPPIEYINNGVGAIIIDSPAGINFNQYLYRVHDLDRLILLSQIAERMLAEGVAAQQANAWLSALPDSSLDPFTGKRPLWSDAVLSYPDPEIGHEFNRGLDLPLP